MNTIISRGMSMVISWVTVAFVLVVPACAEPLSDSMRQSMDAAVAAVKPALVRIRVVSVDYDGGREVKREEAGSGVIISEDGYVVTNHHVAGKAKQLFCTLADKEEVEADLVGTDAMSDIAVIKLRQSDKPYPFAEFGDSSNLSVGDYVLAMGSPLALSQSVTRGIISNTEMIMPSIFRWSSFTLDGEDVGSIVRWIGHDAQIFPGNSGGPLVDLQGKIVGINEISLGLSGAIPSDLAKQVADQLIAQGKVIRSWIGLHVQPLLRSSGLKRGALVGNVVEGSPAHAAGMQPGDILLKVDGQDVVARFPEQLPLVNQMMGSLPIGRQVELTVLRGEDQMKLSATPVERDKVEAKPDELKEWGMAGSNISSFMARDMRRKSTSGVIVRSVRPGGAISEAKPKLREGDVIAEVGGKPVANLDELTGLTDQIVEGKTEPVSTLVGFERKGDRYLTVVKVGVRSLKDPGLEVKKAWLPISSQVITRDLAEALGIPGQTGVRVTQVYPGLAAEAAGLQVGDLIIELDGEEIPASQPEDVEVLPSMIRRYKIGSNAELTIIRGGEQSKMEVVLPESGKLAREMKKYRDDNFEFTCRDIVFLDVSREQWQPEQRGVYVEELGEGGWAALGNLQVGDLVIGVAGKPVTDLTVFQAMMKQVENERAETVILQVQRGVNKLFLELRTAWDEPVSTAVTAINN